MINDMIIQFLGTPPVDYEYLQYIFSGFVLLITLLVVLGFILVILGSFLSFFKGGDSI